MRKLEVVDQFSREAKIRKDSKIKMINAIKYSVDSVAYSFDDW